MNLKGSRKFICSISFVTNPLKLQVVLTFYVKTDDKKRENQIIITN